MADDGNSSPKKTQKEEDSELEKWQSYRIAWVYAEYAFQYGATIVLCMGIGYLLIKLNTGVVLTILGVLELLGLLIY
jgi:hypothetical protein